MTARMYSGQRGALEKNRLPKLNKGMFTSASDEWEMPREFFDKEMSIQ